MTWLSRDFDLLTVLLHALLLSFEALLTGGVFYLLFIARRVPAHSADASRSGGAPSSFTQPVVHGIRLAAAGFASTQLLYIAVDSALLIYGMGFGLREVLTTNYFLAGMLAVAASAAVFIRAGRHGSCLLAVSAVLVLASSVALSHSISRLEDQLLLAGLTAAHHAGTAIWIGAMPYLLLSLRQAKAEGAEWIARRFSRAAIAGVALLAGAGTAMSYFYIGSWSALYGTAYGVMVVAKVALLAMMLALGAGNYLLVRRLRTDPRPLLIRLRRFAEVEIGLGFTVILAAASLTSQPPAVDLAQNRLAPQEIVKRMRPQLPRWKSPSYSALTPPGSIREAMESAQFVSGTTNDPTDIAWSEYNHHWAGLIVLLCGGLALLAHAGVRWARHWPLAFVALAFFIVLRADSENWPLGPRSFWQSFSAPDVLEHRLFALLVVGFAVFEWGVQTRRWHQLRAQLVFPAICALGAALLLTHNHALGNVKEELLAEMSHTPIALLGATAGWSRWMELRLPGERPARIAAWIWPVCLIAVGLVLLNYREA